MRCRNSQILRIGSFANVVDNENLRYPGKNEPHKLTTFAELGDEDSLEQVGDLAKV
ncbi:MAG: hypothetical protein V7K48_17725 [Nostoc sp.]|uniref:hypothetical protein n=1 Tax=Nostoc sp. TaxID=1180 RepID=UPI002FF80FCD